MEEYIFLINLQPLKENTPLFIVLEINLKSLTIFHNANGTEMVLENLMQTGKVQLWLVNTVHLLPTCTPTMRDLKKMEIEQTPDGLSLATEKAAAFNLFLMNFFILAQVILRKKIWIVEPTRPQHKNMENFLYLEKMYS